MIWSVWVGFQSQNGLILVFVLASKSSAVSPFQSQNGLILVEIIADPKLLEIDISIPKWSDFSSFNSSSTNLLSIISIPKWSDFSTTVKDLITELDKISIPKWSDFSLGCTVFEDVIEDHFNPKMV